jgi:hypothetical protein
MVMFNFKIAKPKIKFLIINLEKKKKKIFFLQRLLNLFIYLSTRVYRKMEQTIPGFNTIMEKVEADVAARRARRKAMREARRRSS